MTFSFRCLFELPQTSYLAVDEPELTLASDPRVYISTTDFESPIKSEKRLALRGHGYATEHEAVDAGTKWSNWTQVGLARVGLAADFGTRTKPGGTYFNNALRALENDIGAPVRNDFLGLHTYSDDARPVFAWPLEVSGSKGFHDTWVHLLVTAASSYRGAQVRPETQRALCLRVRHLSVLLRPTRTRGPACNARDRHRDVDRTCCAGREDEEGR